MIEWVAWVEIAQDRHYKHVVFFFWELKRFGDFFRVHVSVISSYMFSLTGHSGNPASAIHALRSLATLRVGVVHQRPFCFGMASPFSWCRVFFLAWSQPEHAPMFAGKADESSSSAFRTNIQCICLLGRSDEGRVVKSDEGRMTEMGGWREAT